VLGAHGAGWQRGKSPFAIVVRRTNVVHIMFS
jgi:hypothetical protein